MQAAGYLLSNPVKICKDALYDKNSYRITTIIFISIEFYCKNIYGLNGWNLVNFDNTGLK